MRPRTKKERVARITGNLIAGVSAGVALGCAGSETGNGETQTRQKRPVYVEMRLEAHGEELATHDRDDLEFKVETALASVERIDFVMPEGDTCDELPVLTAAYAAACAADRDRVRIEGPWMVDLVSGQFEPLLEGIDLLDGAYDSIEVRLASGMAGVAGVPAGDALDGATLDVGGSVVLDGVATPFGLTLATNGLGRFVSKHDIRIQEDSDAVQLCFDVREWFAPLGLGKCIAAGYVPSEGGVLRLERADRRACGDIERTVREALIDSGRVRVQSRAPVVVP